MFDSLLRNHTRIVIDDEGRQERVPATCAEINRVIHSHVITERVGYGNPDDPTVSRVVSCMEADDQLLRLQARLDAANATIGTLRGEITQRDSQIYDLEVARTNDKRLMNGAIQIIFGMGPALQTLLSDDLGAPELTDDRTAVKLTGVTYTVVLDVFNEKARVVPVPTVGVPEGEFNIRGGRLSETQQMNLLGHVTRIKAVAAGQPDPVRELINLVDAPA